MFKRIVLSLFLVLSFFGCRRYGLEECMAAFKGAEGYTYYRYLVGENVYAELVKIKSGAVSAETLADILNGSIVRCEMTAGITVCFGYSRGLSGRYLLNGSLINFQIADNGEYILVGSPYIPDGF